MGNCKDRFYVYSRYSATQLTGDIARITNPERKPKPQRGVVNCLWLATEISRVLVYFADEFAPHSSLYITALINERHPTVEITA